MIVAMLRELATKGHLIVRDGQIRYPQPWERPDFLTRRASDDLEARGITEIVLPVRELTDAEFEAAYKEAHGPYIPAAFRRRS